MGRGKGLAPLLWTMLCRAVAMNAIPVLAIAQAMPGATRVSMLCWMPAVELWCS